MTSAWVPSNWVQAIPRYSFRRQKELNAVVRLPINLKNNIKSIQRQRVFDKTVLTLTLVLIVTATQELKLLFL
jgi:hypothetical protein